MANSFYAFTPEFLPGTRVRSGDINTQFAAIEDGFDLIDASNPLTPLGKNAFTTETGTSNAYAAAMPVTRTTETTGDEVIFFATHTNTAAATLEIDGLGAKSIVRPDGSAIAAGDITDGLLYILRYDATNTRYQLVAPVSSQFSGDMLAANNLSDLANAATARSNLGVDAAGTDNSTDVTLAGQDYLTLSTQEITAGKIALDDLADGTDGELITWDAAGAPAAVAVGTSTHVLTSNGAGAAPTFQAVSDASTDVTLDGTPDYLTISGQVITRGLIDLAADITGNLPLANGGRYIKVKAGGETRVTTTTLENDDDFINISLDNASWYEVKVFLKLGAGSGVDPDFKWQFVFSQALQVANFGLIRHTDGTPTEVVTQNTDFVAENSVEVDASELVYLELTQSILTNATTGGTFKLQWAQNTTSSSILSMYAGSYISVKKLS